MIKSWWNNPLQFREVKMDLRIDWISFTLKTDAHIITASDLYHAAKGLLKGVSNDHKTYIFNGTSFEPCGGRAPYALALARDDAGVRVYGGGPLKSVLFEISGRGCEGLYPLHAAQSFLAGVLTGISRVDFAIDVRSDTRPSDFANERSHQAFRSISYIRSDTGETVYVGSPKSDRFARVYRYNAPHPRHELLRIEHVFRRGLARTTAEIFVREPNLSRFVAAMGNSWGWIHKDWRPDVHTVEKISIPAATRENMDTVNWLYKQVAPAMRRLMREGAIDISDWLEFIYRDDASV